MIFLQYFISTQPPVVQNSFRTDITRLELLITLIVISGLQTVNCHSIDKYTDFNVEARFNVVHAERINTSRKSLGLLRNLTPPEVWQTDSGGGNLLADNKNSTLSAMLTSSSAGQMDSNVVSFLKRFRRSPDSKTKNDKEKKKRKRKDKRRKRKRRQRKKFKSTTRQHGRSTKSVHLIAVNDSSIHKTGERYDGHDHPVGFPLKFWRVAAIDNNVYALDNFEGLLTVKQTGTYLIYFQITVHDYSGRWAYSVYDGNNLLFKCLETEQLNSGRYKADEGHGIYHQCHSISVQYLTSTSRLRIRCMYGSRSILMQSSLTFWGMVQLSS